VLSFERSLDQHHRRRAGPEFVAYQAMVLKLTMGSKSEFYELYSTSKERFALDKTMYPCSPRSKSLSLNIE
jgi:hypothetical protein